MGTDVFLLVDGVQPGGGPGQLVTGGVGYLRASIWMDEENEFIRRFFGEAWDTGQQVMTAQDFDELYEVLDGLMGSYVRGELGVVDESYREFRERLAHVMRAEVPGARSADQRLEWCQGLIEFVRLGWCSAMVGKEVRVLLSR